ncbi:MAG: hypothetical protein QOH47_2610 [Sphingomonadales bacterium]|jgi:hypothetical protein|nr:hypothetical protein [Sphingomonadales bacterium]
MSIIYVHGVKVRSKVHGEKLGDSFRRWLGPKLSVNGAPPGYEPVYWGDLAARFRWNLESRPKTKVLGMGASSQFAGLGSLREASARSRLDDAPTPAAIGPVLDGPALPTGQSTPQLSTVPRERRADFLADLYLAVRPTDPGVDPIIEIDELAGLASAASAVADKWDALVAREPNDASRAQRLIGAVDAILSGEEFIAMGGVRDWITRSGETLRRAAGWPGDAISTIFAELRPTLHEFIAYFVGDVFTYLIERGDRSNPGPIPRQLLVALRRAKARKDQTGEKIVIVSHSMGGQIVYDVLTQFAPADDVLASLAVDHWITCGSQVSLFAEMRLFLGQAERIDDEKLQRPASAAAWTNFYDLNDLVGFIMAPVFEGVTDREYDTGYGLAFAHTGFLARPSFFEAMAARI